MNITNINSKSAGSISNNNFINTNTSKSTNTTSSDAGDLMNISNIANNTSTSSTSSTEHTELTRMNSKKRKRVVNMLVRSVGNPIQQGYVVIKRLKVYVRRKFNI